MTKKALIIGIDNYRNPAWNLQGCVMDAAVMRGMLQDHFGFPGENVRLVIDERATKANILTRLDWLMHDAKPGDVLTFFYAGHGSQVRDRNGDELEDALDEILGPHDLDWDDPLTDDVLNEYFTRVPWGVNLTAILDCCNSGTGTRSLRPPFSSDRERGEEVYEKTRYIDPPVDIKYRSRGLRVKKRRIGETLIKENHILLAACASYQEAKETRLLGKVRGAFSYYLARTLKRADWKLTYRQTHEGTLTRLKDNGFVQIPQLEGPEEIMDTQLFGSSNIVP